MSNKSAQAIVDDILELWKLATPIAVIARTMRLPERLIRHVIVGGLSQGKP